MIGTTLNQRFSLDKELGRGGMGAVYRATDLVLDRSVAIKVLKEQTGEEVGRKIRLEAQILARLVHEYIVRLYDFGEANGLYYFVMEEVDGPSFFRRTRTFDLGGRLRTIAQVADALDYAHHQGVIHRDVKPANVLMTSSDNARLSDFGLSVLMDTAQESGKILGTPHYMSPEQAKGKRLDHRTDLYSLGVMLYEAATGVPPFSGPPFSVIASHIGADPEPVRSRNPIISGDLESLINRLMAKSPEGRPPSGSAVAAEIRHILTTEPAIVADPIPTVVATAPSNETERATRVTIAPGMTLATQVVPISAKGAETAPSSSDLVGAAPAGVAPSSSPASAARTGVRGIADQMLEEVYETPITLTAPERYLAGHYLAYFLGGSRRKGFLRRRPLDPLNADRARLMLAMTWLTLKGADDDAIKSAAEMLDGRVEVRPALSPVVVAKYLMGRDTGAKRKTFREIRRKLQEASHYAKEHLTDDRGVLNPGLLPQVLDDLKKLAPARDEVDDQLVERWNRVAEVWQERPDFRNAVLRYATTSAWSDPRSVDLWPEVVYPLIERARWQRKLRSRPEMMWDGLCEVLHIPDAGNKLEHVVRTVVPARVVEALDVELRAFSSEPELDAFDDGPTGADDPAGRLAVNINQANFQDIESDAGRDKSVVRLTNPNPVRLTLGELHTLWKEALDALQKSPNNRMGHRHVPIGPYRLAVIPSIRGRSAGQVAIQGMKNKQIELLTPSLRAAGSNSKPTVAIWHYQDDSLCIAYCDFRNAQRYIFWHAPVAHQNNFEDAAEMNHALFNTGLEAPDGLSQALSKRFRPKNPV